MIDYNIAVVIKMSLPEKIELKETIELVKKHRLKLASKRKRSS